MHKISETVRSTHSHDGGVVLDIRHGQMFNLNLVGSRVLELLKSGASESMTSVGVLLKTTYGNSSRR
jgi:hypothetical protein